MQPIIFPEYNDSEIVFRIVELKENELFSVLYRRYKTKVLNKCYSILKDRTLAEEFTHEIFSRVFEKLSSFKYSSLFSTWLYAIASNYCFEYRRAVKRGSKTVSEMFNELEHFVEINEDDDSKQEQVLNAISLLSPSDRLMVEMRYIDGMKLKDISENLSLSESAVKMRLSRCKEKLRKIVNLEVPEYS